ncbi:MAG: flagellar basal body-associated FliL family protein [Rhodobacteraceae bacterium]|nr:flagellar basal body-associated FliL family protein [Paracoccaceae bacterium]
MTTTADHAEEAPKKSSKKPLLIGLVLMLALGGGGFYSVYSGLILGGHAQDHAAAEAEVPVEALPDIAFVPIDPLVVSLGTETGRYLHFSGQMEVAKAHQPDVTLLLPRVSDVLNGYLRAVDTAELEDPVALVRLRAQMLRRVQMVTGEGRVRDLLITEFVIN